jgi:murein DD-endopeptidase MepM/ murein hydrolase activator NlpD
VASTERTSRATSHASRPGLHVLGLALLICLLPTSLVAAQESTPEPTVYVVQRGDTLYAIAEKFGTTVKAISSANNIEDASLIVTGQKLVIPSTETGPRPAPSRGALPNSRVHTVQPGEVLPSLAFRYGTTVWDLRQANDIHRLGLLLPGQELVIPPPKAPTDGTPAFPRIATSSDAVSQGRTLGIEVLATSDLVLEGSYLEQELVFVEGEGRYWALVGVDALTAPGSYPLTLTITETQTGDRLAMRQVVSVTKSEFPTYDVPVSPEQQGLLDPGVVQAERKKVNREFGAFSPEQEWTGTFDVPLEGDLRVTAPFGQRRTYAGGPVMSYHTGLDLGADEGVPVSAPITATVALAEELQVRGNAVLLDHGLGVFSGFWHLSRIDVKEGQVVGKGERIGLVGSTGLSTGPHLHWEMRVHNVPVHPMQWTRRAFP